MSLVIAGGSTPSGLLYGPSFKSGDFITPPYATGAGSSTTASTLYLTPFYLPRKVSFDQLGVYVTTGVAATTARLGIFSDDGAGRPSAVLVDAGTTATTTSSAAATANTNLPLALNAGVYWAGIQVEGGTPTIQGAANQMPLIPRTTISNANHTGWSVGSRTGALTSTSGATFTSQSTCPLLFLRVA